uniref:Zinc finger, CCHC-type n=1 Tax=Tanacetum cinerariifolium TaxID=118510 RepID=A0A6L2LD17_TANCI|nr:zinc finger, CCHC-type [Tanacetum cinerariifolium]
MHFLLTTLKVVYVLSTPSPVWSENETLETTRKRLKWETDDYICRGHILNGMSDSLFDIYQNAESAKALWESLETKYMAEDASAKKFLSGLKNRKLDNNPKGKNQIGSSSVNMVEGDGAKNSNNNKNKRKFKSGDDKFANKKGTVTCWKCKKTGHMKKDCRSRKGNDDVGSNGSKDPEKQQGYNYDFIQNFDNVLHYVFCVISDAFYVHDDEVACHNNSLSKSELWHARLGHVHYKRMRDMSKMSLIPAFDMTHESCKTCMLTKITRQPFKGVNRESKVLDVIHSDLCDFHANPSLSGEYYDPVYFQSIGIIHQTTAPYPPQQHEVAERKNRTLKEMVNSILSYSGLSEGFWGEAIAVVRLTEPKMKNLDEKCTDCIFIGYAEHSKCYRFYVIEPNDYVSVNSIIESRDAIFDEERFTSIPRPRGMIQPSSSKIAEDEVEGTDDVPGPSVPRKSTRTRKAKSFGSDFQLYLFEGTRDKTLSQREYCFIIEDPRTLSEAMAYRDVAFWKEAVQTIHDLVIHQMDVKTAFLNGDLDEEIYMKQLEGFVMPGHESKVCKLKKSLCGLKQAPKQWHQKFDDVVLSNGFSLNQADKCVYSKFDASDLGEAEVILGIRIKRENNGISISQSHYIEKILTKFNFASCSPVYTPVDPTVKFRHNKETLVSQLEYSRAIGCLMYAMISTRPDIAFAVGKLSRYTSNPSALH